MYLIVIKYEPMHCVLRYAEYRIQITDTLLIIRKDMEVINVIGYADEHKACNGNIMEWNVNKKDIWKKSLIFLLFF